MPPIRDYAHLENVFSGRGPLEYSIVTNTNPDLVTVTISDSNTLQLSWAPNKHASSEITVKASPVADPRFTSCELSVAATETFEVTVVAGPTLSLTGDANRDGVFDQFDIVQVLQEAKYLTRERATYEQGDWNGDGFFNQLDIVAALQDGRYLHD